MFSSLIHANKSFIKRYAHGRRMKIVRQIIDELMNMNRLVFWGMVVVMELYF